MALLLNKNVAVNTAAITAPSYGNGATGLLYGDAAYLYWIIQIIKAIGGTVTASSTRTSGTGSQANSASNSDLWDDVQRVCYGLAWIAVRMPTVRGITRRLVFQRGDTSVGQTLRAKMNWSSDYTGGTATQVPTIAGEAIIIGGGTDASPTFDVMSPNTDAYILQAIGYNDSPQCWAAAMYPVAGSAVGGAGMFMALDALVDGSFISGCDDAVFLRSLAATPSIAGLTSENPATAQCFARVRVGLTVPGPSWEAVKMLAVGSIPGSAAAEPRGNKKPTARCKYQRDGAPGDSFGLSRLFRWFGPAGSVPRTANLVSAKDLFVLGQLCWPWDGTEPA